MKNIIIVVLLCTSISNSNAQKRLNFNIGKGKPTDYENFATPTFGFGLLFPLNENVNFGARFFYEQYYFNYKPPYVNYLTVNYKSSYVFITPELDASLDRHKQHFHFFSSFGLGLLLSGNEYVDKYAYKTDISDNINHLICRLGVGFKEYANITKHFGLVFTQEFGYIPSKLSKNIGGYPLVPPYFQTNYVSLQLGLSHNYGSIKTKDAERLKERNERKESRLKKREKTTKTFSGAKFW